MGLHLRRFFAACSVLVALNAAAAEWQVFFNERDLSGWKTLGGGALFTVEDGILAGTTVIDTPNSFLATTAVYGDFIFECEVKQESPATNSGVQFRSESRADYQDGRVHGYQLDIDPSDRAWTGGIYDESRCGWLYPGTLNAAGRSAYRLGEWNHLRIEAIGPKIRTWGNGVPTAHVVDALAPRGFFALQVHKIGEAAEAGRRTLWRHLRIQTTGLARSPVATIPIRNLIPNQVSADEQAAGWLLLWDGRTTAGWRGARKNHFPETGWKIADGELVVLESGGGESKKGGDIVTEAEFSAFELQLEFKLTKGANSGIKYFVREEITPLGGSSIRSGQPIAGMVEHAYNTGIAALMRQFAMEQGREVRWLAHLAL